MNAEFNRFFKTYHIDQILEPIAAKSRWNRFQGKLNNGGETDAKKKRIR